MDKEKIMNLCQQIGIVAMSNKKHYPALHSDFDFINDAQMDIFREITAPPKSNADRIRQMTDEELARFLEITSGCSVCFLDATAGECAGFRSSMDCIVNKMKWLKQEVSEDATD